MNSLINILEYLSNYLKKRKEINKTSKIFIFFMVVFTLIAICANIFWIYNLFLESLFILKKWQNIVILYLFLFILILTFFSFLHNLKRMFQNKNEAKIIFFTNIFPMFLWIYGVFLFSLHNFFSYYDILINLILVIYPVLNTFQNIFKKLNCPIFYKIKNYFFVYNLWFFFFLTLNSFFATFWLSLFSLWIFSDIYDRCLNIDFFYNTNIVEILIETIIFLVILLVPIYLLHVHFDSINQNKKKLFVAVILLFFVILWRNYDTALYKINLYLVNRSNAIIDNNWENYESYKKAKWFFTEKAYLYLEKNKRILYDNSNFQKLYDSSFEEYFWDKYADYSDDSRNFATNLSKIWEKAQVVLSLWEIENKIINQEWLINYTSSWKINIIETTYRFYYTNESDTNQEVIMFFETPSKYSVVTDLKLWLDLEMLWQIAPRWAAKQVYKDSLRKNIDPALIEKIWLNTYSLRVFPIPAKTDKKSNWKQLVEIKVLSPIIWDKIYYSPKFSFANLKTDKDSSFITKIYNNNNLIKEDIQKWNNINSYINSNHFIFLNEVKLENNNNNFWDFCLDEYLNNIVNNYSLLEGNKSKSLDKKYILFFDNSESVKRNEANKLYNDIFNSFKNNSWVLNDIDIYSYNFEVNKLSHINDIKYRWYNNIDRVIDYIINNNIENKNIIFITDDSNFNLWIEEDKTRNLKKLISNKISVIKIWKKIKSYKSDFNSILATSDWNIYNLNNKNEIQNIIDLINDNEEIKINNCVSYNNNEINKIQAGYISNLILKEIEDEKDWGKATDLQNTIAKNYNIVNQFNSFIALQTPEQQIELDKYKQQNNKYDSDYENYWKTWLSVDSPIIFGVKSDSSHSNIIHGLPQYKDKEDNIINTDINIFIIFKIFAYLIQYIWIFTFIVKLFKKNKI